MPGVPWMLSFQLHADALGAVEQPSQVEAGQRIVGMQPDQRGKRRHRRGVAGFEFQKGFGILPGRRFAERSRRQRLEDVHLDR